MSLAVGLLHFTAPPVVGGVETVIGQHVRLLAGAGHRVRLIVGRGGTGSRSVEVVRLPLADGRARPIRDAQRSLDRGEVPPSFPALVDELTADLRRATVGLDVLVAHNVCSLNLNVPLTAALARLAAGQAAPRVVAWAHDVAATSPAYRSRLHPGDPWDLYRSPWPGAAHVAVSEARRYELVSATGVAPEAVTVVPNGIDTGVATGLRPATRALVAALALDRAWPVLFAPARLVPRKNLALAIEVVAALRRGGDDARVIITGEPDPHAPRTEDHLNDLRALAERTGATPGVHLLVDGPTRWRSASTIADLFRVADALFYPSRDEGFGLPVLEAAACRLPVVCADIPALREIAGDDATYVDPSGDPDRVAAVVRERLAADAADRLRRRVRSGYAWDAILADRIEPLLLRVAGGG